MTTWQEVNHVYQQALRDLDDLAAAKAVGPLWTTAETAKSILVNKFHTEIINHWGTSEMVMRNLKSWGRTVILSLAYNAATKMAMRMAAKESGKDGLVRDSFNYRTGEIHIYTTSISGPDDEKWQEQVIQTDFKYKTYEDYARDEPVSLNLYVMRLVHQLGIDKWALVESPDHKLLSDEEFSGNRIMVKHLYDLEKIRARIMADLQARWGGY